MAPRTPRNPLADFPVAQVGAWLAGNYGNNHAELFAGQALIAWAADNGIELPGVPHANPEAFEPTGSNEPTGEHEQHVHVAGIEIGDGKDEETPIDNPTNDGEV